MFVTEQVISDVSDPSRVQLGDSGRWRDERTIYRVFSAAGLDSSFDFADEIFSSIVDADNGVISLTSTPNQDADGKRPIKVMYEWRINGAQLITSKLPKDWAKERGDRIGSMMRAVGDQISIMIDESADGVWKSKFLNEASGADLDLLVDNIGVDRVTEEPDSRLRARTATRMDESKGGSKKHIVIALNALLGVYKDMELYDSLNPTTPASNINYAGEYILIEEGYVEASYWNYYSAPGEVYRWNDSGSNYTRFDPTTGTFHATELSQWASRATVFSIPGSFIVRIKLNDVTTFPILDGNTRLDYWSLTENKIELLKALKRVKAAGTHGKMEFEIWP